MIENGAAALLADTAYGIMQKFPRTLNWSAVPALIRVATLDLHGIPPVTEAMGETLHDKPSDGEIALSQQRGSWSLNMKVGTVARDIPGHQPSSHQIHPKITLSFG